VYDGLVKYDIVGYDRHGVVAVDTSPWRAFEHIERLEHICKIVLAAS
jgi:ribulose-5-phosphate 4-epimerase/fuculose-1-phosphate aldolase